MINASKFVVIPYEKYNRLLSQYNEGQVSNQFDLDGSGTKDTVNEHDNKPPSPVKTKLEENVTPQVTSQTLHLPPPPGVPLNKKTRQVRKPVHKWKTHWKAI